MFHGVEGGADVEGNHYELSVGPSGGLADGFDHQVGDGVRGVANLEAVGSDTLEEVGEVSGYGVSSPYAVAPLSVGADAGNPS